MMPFNQMPTPTSTFSQQIRSSESELVLREYFGDHGAEVPEHLSFRQDNVTRFVETPIDEFVLTRQLFNNEFDSLRSYLPKDAYIAGGYVASLLGKTKSGDVDIFFSTMKAFEETFSLLTNPPEALQAWAWTGYKSVVTMEDIKIMNPRTVTFINEDPARPPIQLIKLIWFEYGPIHVIDSFDFTVCQFAVHGNSITYNPLGLADLLERRLVFNRQHYPVNSIMRLIKYVKKGFNMPTNQVVALAEYINHAETLNGEGTGINGFY